MQAKYFRDILNLTFEVNDKYVMSVEDLELSKDGATLEFLGSLNHTFTTAEEGSLVSVNLCSKYLYLAGLQHMNGHTFSKKNITHH